MRGAVVKDTNVENAIFKGELTRLPDGKFYKAKNGLFSKKTDLEKYGFVGEPRIE